MFASVEWSVDVERSRGSQPAGTPQRLTYRETHPTIEDSLEHARPFAESPVLEQKIAISLHLENHCVVLDVDVDRAHPLKMFPVERIREPQDRGQTRHGLTILFPEVAIQIMRLPGLRTSVVARHDGGHRSIRLRDPGDVGIVDQVERVLVVPPI